MDALHPQNLLTTLLRIEQARQPVTDRATLPPVLQVITQEIQTLLQADTVMITLCAERFDPPWPLGVVRGANDPTQTAGIHEIHWAGVHLATLRIVPPPDDAALTTMLPLLLRMLGESIAEVRAVELLVQQTQERIRRELADELHASVQQILAGIRLLAERTTREIARDPHYATRLAQDIREAAQQGFTEQRFVIHGTRGHDLRHTFHDDLQRLLDQLTRQVPDLQLTRSLDVPVVSADVAACLIHTVRNVLANIALHAQAQAVHIRIAADDPWVALHIRDDGVGCDLEAALAAPGIGLNSVIERVTTLGGRYQLTGAPGSGVQLDVWLPLPSGRSDI
jgi:signal transduction histidine kinase